MAKDSKTVKKTVDAKKTVKKDAPAVDKKADPRAGMKSSNGGSTKTSDTIEQIK